MALSDIDRNLIERCLAHKPHAWEDFVDRFMGLVVHVVNHTAQNRSMRLSHSDREDLVAEVFYTLVDNDLAVLRHFRGESSLATYLTVVARRVVVRKLVAVPHAAAPLDDGHLESHDATAESRIEDREEVAQMLESLAGTEAEVVRLYHMEGKSYGEISQAVDVPENTIGPMLTRARTKLRSHVNRAPS
ncbi:sigma-70 family RNA polymerase sigma factor [Aeoliella sp. ICT_H6.2]|uniref:Sigma-70 family RNA polymerase sigma factor n=1 Tax=Aeoliella straminimaris TaxID=2954799 RepID=A0A9X2JKC3_9BACT|nr:sigma-70 family RNA polymerase sigma factor [Aeoliella straminimaris]